MKFVERFEEFLKENVKADWNLVSLSAYLDDLKTQFGNTGSCYYELSKFESKSRNPEVFDYEYEEIKEYFNLED